MNLTINYYVDNDTRIINEYMRELVRADHIIINPANIDLLVFNIEHECKCLDMFACIVYPDGTEIWYNI